MEWVRSGHWNRTAEQIAEAETYWEQKLGEEMAAFDAAYTTKKERRDEDYTHAITVAQATASEKAILLEQERQAELAAMREAAQERILLFALEMLEHKEALQIPIEGFEDMEVSAQEYFELIKAGVIPVSDALMTNIGTATDLLTGKWEDWGTTGTENMDHLMDAAGGVFDSIVELQSKTDEATGEMKTDWDTEVDRALLGHMKRLEEAEMALAGIPMTSDATKTEIVTDFGNMDLAIIENQGKYGDLELDIIDLADTHGTESDKMIGGLRDLQGSIGDTSDEMGDLESATATACRGMVRHVGNVIDEIGDLKSEIRDASRAWREMERTTAGGVTGPGLQAGLAYVPATMPAIIHQGEAVLTREQASRWRTGQGGPDIHIHMGGDMFGIDGVNEAVKKVMEDMGRYTR